MQGPFDVEPHTVGTTASTVARAASAAALLVCPGSPIHTAAEWIGPHLEE